MNKRISTLPFEPWMGSRLKIYGNEKAVFAAIWERTKDEPCEISAGDISERTGLSVPTVLKYIYSLECRGYIKLENRGHGSTANKYSIPDAISIMGWENNG